MQSQGRGAKVEKKSPQAIQTHQQKPQRKEKQNPRKPLKEPNSSCSTSVEAPRGCFRFLLSNSSSKTSLPRSKSLPRTPNSAPNARYIDQKTATNASNPRSKLPKKNPNKPSCETPDEPRSHNSQKPKSSHLLQWQNAKRPTFGGHCRERDEESKAHKRQFSTETATGNSSQLKFMTLFEESDAALNELASGFHSISSCGNVLEMNCSTQAPGVSSSAVSEMNVTPGNKLPSGSCLLSTPYKALDIHFAAPPLRASVSPAIDAGKLSELRIKPQTEISGAPADEESKFWSGSRLVNAHGKTFEDRSITRLHDLSFRGVLGIDSIPATKLPSGSCLVSFDKDSDEHFKTPPLHVSISPQIDSGKPPSQPRLRPQLVINGTPADEASKLSTGSCLAYVDDKDEEEHFTMQPRNLRLKDVLEMNFTPVKKFASGSCSISTPCKVLDKYFRTPPLQVSISTNPNSGELSELRLNPQFNVNGAPASRASKFLSRYSFVYEHNRASEEKSTMPPPDLSFKEVLEMNATPINKSISGSCLLSTPETTTTPPIQASISPEIMCGSSLLSTPACFAAGHVVVGISDKRKCRPRGILTVEEEFKILDICTSRVSLVPAPAEASMHWLSSPAEDAKKSIIKSASPECKGLAGPTPSGKHVVGFSDGRTERVSLIPPPAEASMNWLLSSREDAKKSLIGKSSHELEGLTIPNTSTPDAAPLSDNEFCDSSSVDASHTCRRVLEGSAVSLGGKVLTPQKERSYRYNHMVENSPSSTDSRSSCNFICTPLSDSSSDRHAGFSCMKMEDLSTHQLDHKKSLEDIQCMSISSESQVIPCDPVNVSPTTHANFQFPCPDKISNSIDVTNALKPLHDQVFNAENFGRLEEGMPRSNLENMSRISWREGLVSRIFNVGEFDCCQWLLDEEEDVNYCRDDQLKFESGLEFDPNVMGFSPSDENDWTPSCGFGSPSIIYEQDDQEIKGKLPSLGPISCAESISMDRGGLTASGDSDWTIFYKNKLFEV